MTRRRIVSRRSFLQQITGGLAGTGALMVVSAEARAFQVTDSDRVINDQPGQGRGPRSGITDRDPNDAVGNGTGGVRQRPTGPEPARPPSSPFEEPTDRRRPSGITDRDPSDPAGDGRGSTDAPPPSGNSRGEPPPRRTCTDTDSGTVSDPVGRGRRC